MGLSNQLGGHTIMKAIIDAGINEKELKVGDTVSWGCADMPFRPNDTIAWIERNDNGEITVIAFAHMLKFFTNRHKLVVGDDLNARPDSLMGGNAVAWWYYNMIRRGAFSIEKTGMLKDISEPNATDNQLKKS